MTWLAHSQRSYSRLCFARQSIFRMLCAVTVIAVTVAARAETEGPSAPNPENVLVVPPTIKESLERMMQPSAAVAAPRTAERRTQRMRSAKSKAKKSEPAPAPPELPVRIDQPFWPNAHASAGTGDLTPMAIKTVREMTVPDREETVVLANELSDLDLAAKPAAETSVTLAATDGRASADADAPPAANSRFAFMSEAVSGLAQMPWVEPILLVLAGAIAGISALRLFA